MFCICSSVLYVRFDHATVSGMKKVHAVISVDIHFPPFFLLVCRIPRGIRIEDERRRDDNQNMRACAQHKKKHKQTIAKE